MKMDNTVTKSTMDQDTVISRLAAVYPQLFLNPDTQPKETFAEVVLKGASPSIQDLSWYCTDPGDKDEMLKTPVGDVRVITLCVRRDFEYFLRSMMAVKDGPEAQIPASQGAATISTFNWTKIRAHRDQFIEEQYAAGNRFPDWKAEWAVFSSVKANYMDQLVVLSIGPYSAVDSSRIGYSREEWMEYSDTIRKYHELTHVICRNQYPDQISALWDEIVADAIGLYAAFGRYDPDKARLFLGIEGEKYRKGRLENYTDQPQEQASYVCEAIAIVDQIMRDRPGQDPFRFIPEIQEKQIV